MELVAFSVTNFRSITQANKTPISDITVLIGKNNEGKSNMLRALNIAMHVLRYHADSRRTRYNVFTSRKNEHIYYWSRDFPITLQNQSKSTQSIFRLEFHLNDEEIAEFRSEIKSNLNGTLPIEIRIGKDGEPKISVIKKGKGAKTLNSKSKIIAEYIANRISFNYIPAVRTDQEAISVVQDMLSLELSKLETNPDYQKALDTIKELQLPILETLSTKIKDSLTEFIPHVNNVSIEIQEHQRRSALRREFEVFVDDGNKTSLEFKGDGVKSLAALGLLKNISIARGSVSLTAIEEPESHLHPGAIHILRDTIFDLIDVNQVIISTHNPLFIDRHNLKSNIIIDAGNARPAKNIQELREVLGIKASDNLLNANYVLVVEGEEDVTALKGLLPHLSEKIGKAIKNNIFIIDKIGGAGNLSYKLSLLKNTLCVFHVLLDNDSAGQSAYEKASLEDNLKLKDVTFINCNGMSQSEFEDCINKDCYQDQILGDYGVNINVSEFRGNDKWSDRMRKTFLSQGKLWNDQIEKQVKHTVSVVVSKKPALALNEHKRSSIDSLVNSLENLIDKTK